jgi:hypothetical protein
MGHWGVKSYENDDAGDALDAGFARAHGSAYEELMDDSNPMTLEQVQQKLASPESLTCSIQALADEAGSPFEAWDEVLRLAFAGVVVRHAELGVTIPPVVRERAILCLREETIEWEETTARRLRRDREIRLLDSEH